MPCVVTILLRPESRCSPRCPSAPACGRQDPCGRDDSLISSARRGGGRQARRRREPLARGNQNAHELELRPSLMLKLRRADILLENGLGARHVGRRGRPRREQSQHRPRRARPHRRVARHPGARGAVDAGRSFDGRRPSPGQPALLARSGMAPVITQNIVDAFARFAPDRRSRVRAKPAGVPRTARRGDGPAWTRTMEPLKGAKVVVYHPQWIYLLTRFGLSQAGDARGSAGDPGDAVPSDTDHPPDEGRADQGDHRRALERLKLATRVADEAGAKAVVLASMVGGVKGADSYIEAIDHNVNGARSGALR